jgi:hypothetical protein
LHDRRRTPVSSRHAPPAGNSCSTCRLWRRAPGWARGSTIRCCAWTAHACARTRGAQRVRPSGGRRVQRRRYPARLLRRGRAGPQVRHGPDAIRRSRSAHRRRRNIFARRNGSDAALVRYSLVRTSIPFRAAATSTAILDRSRRSRRCGGWAKRA